MIVRWGLGSLGPVLEELDVSRALLVTSERWRHADLPVGRRFEGVRPHVPTKTVEVATAAAEGADGVVALGGGSAVATTEMISAMRAHLSRH